MYILCTVCVYITYICACMILCTVNIYVLKTFACVLNCSIQEEQPIMSMSLSQDGNYLLLNVSNHVSVFLCVSVLM